MTLEEALALGFRITEVDAAGSVPELIAFNPLDTPVLLYDGEELLGAKQNRILNVTVLVAPKSETKIPVSCVEQGRWHARSARLKTKTPRQAGLFEERMMGLEPTTFCMASARDVRTRSGAFAEAACLQRLRRSERTDANPSERRTLPFLPRGQAFGISFAPAAWACIRIGYAASARLIPCSRRASASACALTGPTPLTSAHSSGPAARSRSTLPNRSSNACAVASEIPGIPLST